MLDDDDDGDDDGEMSVWWCVYVLPSTAGKRVVIAYSIYIHV